jgi:hypothetical protein
MWLMKVVCSDTECGEEFELMVEELEEVDRAICACECSVITLAVANFEPVDIPRYPLPGARRLMKR